MGIKAFLIGLLFISINAAYAGTLTYKLPGFPKIQSDCGALASELGDKFKAATNLEVDIALCTGESADGFNIEITYLAEAPLAVVSSWPRFHSIYSLGRFKTRQDCEARLASDEVEFQRNTLLTPVFSFCSKYDSSDKGWSPRIDAFGKPDKNYFVSGFHIYALPKEPASLKLREKLAADLSRKNAFFVDLSVRSSMAYGEVVVHYYANDRLAFEMTDTLRTATEAECASQLSEVEQGFSTSKNPPAVLFCGRPTLGGRWELDMLFIGSVPLRNLESLEVFKDFAACRSALPQLKAKYAANLKKEIPAIACTLNEGSYKALIYYP